MWQKVLVLVLGPGVDAGVACAGVRDDVGAEDCVCMDGKKIKSWQINA